jgi:hypothetical protein
VLTCFDQPTKARVLEAVARQMPEDGLLYLGGAETALGVTTSFVPLAEDRGVYARRALPPVFPFGQLRRPNRAESPARGLPAVAADSPLAGPCSA